MTASTPGISGGYCDGSNHNGEQPRKTSPPVGEGAEVIFTSIGPSPCRKVTERSIRIGGTNENAASRRLSRERRIVAG
jgi:hypothetical protein